MSAYLILMRDKTLESWLSTGMSFRTRLPRNSQKAENRCLETRFPPSAH